ncbi:Myosin assembly protein/sexual cycle protein and related proteins [Phaffia rhodozyma]|uniref:Myosin assembly protein/sexual cycle protein and related proteins n=1 Tax=Phaffia rhodozyma TaxID=264483 RepID=A0A0F7SLQ1_PHARH|nr:Myosin assembly protein/sexual cycle protein and related proteins [Phaffia rhodozyma]
MPSITELPADVEHEEETGLGPTESSLQEILSSNPGSGPFPLTEHTVWLLSQSFAPSRPVKIRALGFVALSRLSTQTSTDPLVSTATAAFSPSIETALLTAQPRALVDTLSLLAALVQACPFIGTALLNRPGLIENLYDLTDLFPSSATCAPDDLSESPSHLSSSPPSAISPDSVLLGLTELLSQAANSPLGRKSIFRSTDAPWTTYLETLSSRSSTSNALRASSAAALAKLSRGKEADKPSDATSSTVDTSTSSHSPKDNAVQDARLAALMKSLIVSLPTSDPSLAPLKSTLDALETLAFTSLRPAVKDFLSADRAFLQALFRLVPAAPKPRAFNEPASITHSVGPSLHSSDDKSFIVFYGVASVIVNLVSYRPARSAEETQLDRLRRMTLSGEKASSSTGRDDKQVEEDPLESDEAVKIRAERLLNEGVVETLIVLGKAESVVVRETVGRIWLGLLTNQKDRKRILQQGGAKALISLTSSLTGRSSCGPLNGSALNTIQALAKLLITESPLSIFGPTYLTSSADPIRPIALLLLDSASSLLQQFEALMALTNLASVQPDNAYRIGTFETSSTGSVLSKMLELMIEDNQLVRRASTELACNLLASEQFFNSFLNSAPTSQPPSVESEPKTKNKESKPNGGSTYRLRLLMALSTLSDLPTRSAASGALAMLTSSADACRILIARPKDEGGASSAIRTILDLFQPPCSSDDSDNDDDEQETEQTRLAERMSRGPDPGLVLRASVILIQILESLPGEPSLSDALKEEKAKQIIVEARDDLEGMMSDGKQKMETMEAVNACIDAIDAYGS